MTKKLFIIISIIYLSLTAIFATVILKEGLLTLGLSVATLAVLAWGFVKIKYEYEGFKQPQRKRGPESF